MIERPLWTARIRRAWEKASVVWLSGVRRVAGLELHFTDPAGLRTALT